MHRHRSAARAPDPHDINWIHIVLTPLAAALVLSMSSLTAGIYRNVIRRSGVTVFRLLILSLSCSDISLGLGLVTKFVLSLRRDWMSQPAACLVCLCLIFCPLYVSQAHLLLLSAERYASVRYPDARATWLRHRRLLLSLAWLYGLGVAGPVQLASFRHSFARPVRCTFSRDHQPAYQAVLVGLFFASAAALLLTNWRLCEAARSANSRIHPRYPAAVLPAAVSSATEAASAARPPPARAVRHLALVVGAFTACHLPLMSYLCAVMLAPHGPQSSYLALLYYPTYLASGIGFLVHARSAPEFRRELRRQWTAALTSCGAPPGGGRRARGGRKRSKEATKSVTEDTGL